MIKVKRRANETERAIAPSVQGRRVKREGLTKDIKRVAYYEKPSEKPVVAGSRKGSEGASDRPLGEAAAR